MTIICLVVVCFELTSSELLHCLLYVKLSMSCTAEMLINHKAKPSTLLASKLCAKCILRKARARHAIL